MHLLRQKGWARPSEDHAEHMLKTDTQNQA
jgi:hypothetical protein